MLHVSSYALVSWNTHCTFSKFQKEEFLYP